MIGERKKIKAMIYDQSLLKKNPSCYLECTVLYKRYRSLALNIGLFEIKRKKKRKSAKMSFGTNSIFTVFKVPFLQQEKKVLQRQGIGLLFVFSLKLSQKQNEHASSTFFFFQNSTLAAKRMSLKTRPYTFSLKKTKKKKRSFECDKKVKQKLLTSIL